MEGRVAKVREPIADDIAGVPFPPGTSKWNKIEHRLFSPMSIHWRGRSLSSVELIVRLIGATTTRTGLRVESDVDASKYPGGLKVSTVELATVQCVRDDFHGEWNHRIQPKAKL